MPIDWAPFVDLVRRHQRFLLTTHIRPDGDGLGSMLALADVLEAPPHKKTVRMTVASVLPPRYDFLDPKRRIRRFEPPGDAYRDADAAIVLDTGTWNQLGDFGNFLRPLPVQKVVIDHHLTQDDLGALRLADTTAEATGRLVFEAITALGGPMPASAAHALFIALAMDTGWFRHNNTTPATFTLASELVRAGARPTEAYECLFEQSTLGRLKLTGLVLDRLQLAHGGRVAHTEIRRDDYETTGATPQDSEDLVNYTRSLAGVEVGLFFMEQPRGGVKVSFRSRQRIDVARLAERFGGGGHRLASGAILETTLDEARTRVLAAVGAALDPPPNDTSGRKEGGEPGQSGPGASDGAPPGQNSRNPPTNAEYDSRPRGASTHPPESHPMKENPTLTPAPRAFTLRQLPLAARLTLAVFLISVGIGYVSALVQLHFQHASPGEIMPTPQNAVRIFHGDVGEKPKSKIEQLLPEKDVGPFNGSGQMTSAFTKRSEDPFWKTAIKEKARELAAKAGNRRAADAVDPAVAEAELRKERDSERRAVLAWIEAGASEKDYKEDKFCLPDDLAKRPMTDKFLVKEDDKIVEPRMVTIKSILDARCARCHSPDGDPKASQFPLDTFQHLKPYVTVKTSTGMSLEKLAQTTHVHLLGFSMLYGLTGLILAFSSYPRVVRILLCPLPLVAQVVDISFWWLARLPEPQGPRIAESIVITGGVVAVGLLLHILLSLFDLFSKKAWLVLILLLGAASYGGYVAKERVIDPYLAGEKAPTTAQ